ncbi:unnamed protein product [Coffea canephora]|uniref:Uncharacterized protein n=1 Tax=Coffea canephora TaxID=49390 RepID=A0A068V4Z3_COFCA|nr:unnamed protein product [Coffea canephora]
MDDVPIHKIQISGPALASLLLRFSSSSGAIHGFLFGHVPVSATFSLSDDLTSNLDPSSADADAGTAIPLLTTTVTSFLSHSNPSRILTHLPPLSSAGSPLAAEPLSAPPLMTPPPRTLSPPLLPSCSSLFLFLCRLLSLLSAIRLLNKLAVGVKLDGGKKEELFLFALKKHTDIRVN